MNTQPIEKRWMREDGSLDLVSIFYTIQGEGPLTGTPAVFIRLAGCTLTCPVCDSDYTKGRALHPPSQILDAVRAVQGTRHYGLVVITGGEPYRQNLLPLVDLLLDKGYRVQIETNGTLYQKLPDEICIVCSPKTTKIHPKIMEDCSALKYVLAAGFVDPVDGLPTSSLGMMGKPVRPSVEFLEPDGTGIHYVFVSPQDDGDEKKNATNIAAAVESCLKFGYRLSLQTHKILGLP